MGNIYFYIFTFCSLVLSTFSQTPTINSTLGDIVGKTSKVHLEGFIDRNVHEYLGIPYAQPPTGDLRFRKPEPLTSLPSPFYAQTHGAICTQFAWTTEAAGVPQSEDCLFLNVYVPERDVTIPAESPNTYAVMVWIHGGGFEAGASNHYNGSTLAATGNIIVVTVNYRLGVFGFLSTGYDKEPRNFGLWDQHMALQWVHDYIGDFGGDNEKVTIAGGSAGGISVVLQALSPKINHGLFHRVITQSGSVSGPNFGLDKDGWKDTVTVAGSLGCMIDSAEEVMDCLREKTVDEYLTILQNLFVRFGPLVDDDLIGMNYLHITKMSENKSLKEVEFFRSLDILSGFNAFEGAFMLPFVMGPPGQIENIQITREEMRTNYLPSMFSMDFADEVMKVVEAQYTNWTNPDDYNSVRLQITKLIGDRSFAIPAIEMARIHNKSGKNFMYHFAPKPSAGRFSVPSWIPGATHADEILFMFGTIGKIGVGKENAWEIELAMKMMKYWTNFVKTGNPNSPDPVSPKWPGYSIDTGDYLMLDKSMSDESARQHFYAEEANFWLEVFPDLVDAVQEDDKGNCGDGTFTSAAPNVPVYNTAAFITVVTLAFFSMF